jgi:hypothetical protein
VPLVRLKPDPTPTPRPVPEYLANPELKLRYDDMKAVLGVPWMGVVAMAFAHYRSFYDAFWEMSRPWCSSNSFLSACQSLRAGVEKRVGELAPPPLRERLVALGYAPREIEAIREAIDVFSVGNYPYVLLATLARLLLERQVPQSPSPARSSSAEDRQRKTAAPLVLMEMHHADAPTQAVYADIKATLGLPVVNTDYRALARWPSYFSRAWADLKPNIGTDSYETFASDVHGWAVEAAAASPAASLANSAALRQAATRDASVDEVLAVVRLFQWLLPGLVINVAFFRQQLDSA